MIVVGGGAGKERLRLKLICRSGREIYIYLAREKTDYTDMFLKRIKYVGN